MTTAVIVKQSLIGQANALALEHENFDMHIGVGRQMLYDLLAKIYGLSAQLDASVDKDALVKIMKLELASKYGIKTQENTSDTTVLVRYITRADRKTAHVYARAIQTAKSQSIASADFKGFIENQGGVERIRALSATSENDASDSLNDDERMDLTFQFLCARSELPFASFDEPKQFFGIDNVNCGFEYVICVRRGGKYLVVGKAPAETALENSILKSFSKKAFANIAESKPQLAKLIEKANEAKQERINASNITSKTKSN